MKKTAFSRIALAVLALLLLAGPVFAQRKITIKLASPVPENTPWGAILNRFAAECAQITGGEVTVQIYHNGVAGGEPDMMRKLRQNQIQAAIFSSAGLSLAVQEIMTLSVPFLIQTGAEMDMILEREKADLEQKFEKSGFYMLAWAKAGWVRFFSKDPVRVPQDLKRMKLSTDPEQPAITQALKAMGYQLVPTIITENITALSSGLIDAVWQSPLSIGAFQIFGIAKNMADFNVAPFMGGLLFNQRAWRTIPDKYKPQLIASAKKIEKELDSSIEQLENDAIKTMKQYGLVANEVGPAQQALWKQEMDAVIPGLLGDVSKGAAFDKTLYDRIVAALAAYRRG